MTKDQNKNDLMKLAQFPVEAAGALRKAMGGADLKSYKKFLDTMYHYTKHSERNLRNAAQAAHTPELKDFFEHMAREERGHYLLAQKDLEGFNEKVSAEDPATVKAINALWDGLQSSRHGNGYLGIVYVFENVAKHVGPDIKALLARLNVTKKQSRWLSVHAEADLEHGGDVETLALKYISDQPELMLHAVQKACTLWIELMSEAFDTSGVIRRVA